MALKFIVGLGNPGRGYENTRHNLGFMAVRALAARYRFPWKRSRILQSFMTQGAIQGHPCGLLLPLTYMNRSGTALRKLVTKRAVAPADILVVCDDFYLEWGQLRIRRTGSDGGHNGLHSVIEALGTRDFNRLRIGLGMPPIRQDAVDFVLCEFKKAEKKKLDPVLEAAVECCVVWLTAGMEKAMNMFNKRKCQNE